MNDKTRKRRKRRDEVIRTLPCMFPGCEKAYGSDNTLSQHIKIKHPEFWQQLKINKERVIKGQDMIFEKNEDNREEKDYFFEDVDKKIKSTFRSEKKASAVIYPTSPGNLRFNDFVLPTMSSIEFVQNYFSLSFIEALRKVALDFKVSKLCVS